MMYEGRIDALRAPQRLKRLEVERVVELSLEKLFVTKVLDTGTGTGIFAESFSLRNINVTGVDINPDMLNAALQIVPGVDFRKASAEKLPFNDKSFDIVFLGLVLHESDHPLDALKEAYRVAVSRVVILEWIYREEEYGPPLDQRFKVEKVTKLARSAGFKKTGKVLMSHYMLYRLNF